MDLRYVLMLLMNLVKSFMGAIVHTWDAFGLTTTWYHFAMLLVFLFFLSFLSITSPGISQSCIQLQFHKLSLVVFISFVFSIVLPPLPCWIYLTGVWLSTFGIISDMFEAFLQCLETNLRRIPAYNVNFTADIDDLEAAGAHDSPV